MTTRSLSILALLPLLGACAAVHYSPPPEFQQGMLYTQVTMKTFRANRIGHTNFLLQPSGLIPAGTPVRVVSMNPRYFVIDINGIRHYLTPEQRHAWNLGLASQILRKYVGPVPPALPANYHAVSMNLNTMPAGLTREEVLVLLGYPSHVGMGVSTENLTREQVLATDNWTYYLNVWRVHTRVDFRDGRSLPVRLPR